ncbi:cytidine deaminase [Candidatus Aquicultor secundus]|nr:cytidine deaminase [Candidatus Aquicultor secundus]NCO65301.1 cytidine deaminase [Solirubrobacter sp.]
MSVELTADSSKRTSFMDDTELIQAAITEARQNAYAPYSGFRVGAALLCEDGRVFLGANVENAVYGLTMCAERVAVANAVTAGCRSFEALAVVADGPTPCPVCGACRQVLAEFGPETRIIMANIAGEVKKAKLKDLLPTAFTNEQLFNEKR